MFPLFQYNCQFSDDFLKANQCMQMSDISVVYIMQLINHCEMSMVVFVISSKYLIRLICCLGMNTYKIPLRLIRNESNPLIENNILAQNED